MSESMDITKYESLRFPVCPPPCPQLLPELMEIQQCPAGSCMVWSFKGLQNIYYFLQVEIQARFCEAQGPAAELH